MILRLNASIQMSDFIAEKKTGFLKLIQMILFLRKFYCFPQEPCLSNHASPKYLVSLIKPCSFTLCDINTHSPFLPLPLPNLTLGT